MHFSTILSGAVAAASVVSAHPGHNHAAEAVARRAAMANLNRRDLSHCADKLRARGVEKRTIERRKRAVEALIKKRGAKRDLATFLATSHQSSASYTASTDATTIFAGNTSCILQGEVTEGPYYVNGEYVRSDVRESQQGVDLTLDLQMVDMNTCEPVPNAYLEIWHANSTGVYSGVVASGNGDVTDLTNLDNTFLRGAQKTDADGFVQFETLVPGHYTGRAPHIHILVHLNATAQPNGTIMTTEGSHSGQAFLDQSLLTEVAATAPYSSNQQPLTLNSEDDILAEEAATSDPFLEYVRLGDSVEDGIFGWLGFAIDTSYSRTYSNAATHYAEGGVANANSGMGAGGPPSGGPPSGGPGGAAPSGTPQ